MRPWVDAASRLPVGGPGATRTTREGSRSPLVENDRSDGSFEGCLEAVTPRGERAPDRRDPARGAPGAERVPSHGETRDDARGARVERRVEGDARTGGHVEADARRPAKLQPSREEHDVRATPGGDPALPAGAGLLGVESLASSTVAAFAGAAVGAVGRAIPPTVDAAPPGASETLDLAALTGRDDVRIEVISVEGGVDASPPPDAPLPLGTLPTIASARSGAPLMTAAALGEGASILPDAASGEAVWPSTETVDPSAVATGGAVADEIEAPEARALREVGPDRVAAPVSAGDASGQADNASGGPASEESFASDARGEAGGASPPSSETSNGTTAVSRDALVVPGRAAAEPRVMASPQAAVATLPADDDAAPETFGSPLERMPSRIVVGVADRDGAWQMELRRGDAGLDVLLRGDSAFVGAVRGVETDLREALLGSGERDARIRVDMDTAGGGSAATGRDGGRRGQPPASERGRPEVPHGRDGVAGTVEEGRVNRGLRLDRMI